MGRKTFELIVLHEVVRGYLFIAPTSQLSWTVENLCESACVISIVTAKMPQFDQSKAYAEQEEQVYFDDGREIDLLHFVYNKPNIDEIRGSPEKVLQAIDEYGRQKKYLMNVGEDKGKIVSDLIREVKPEVMVS